MAPGFAPAKINLTLHVTGQAADGRHLLDSLVMFAGLGDRLDARLAAQPALEVTGPMAAGVPDDGRNLVLRAAEHYGVGAAFRLKKHLPAAAGIGGGSSDAAAALRLLAGLTGRSVPRGIEALGADIPVCLLARAARMRGIGECVAPLDGLPDLPCVLVNPRVDVPTGAVFAALREKENTPMVEVIPPFGDPPAMAAWLAEQRNDLEAPALTLEPVIARVLARLRRAEGVLLARMSGSGATCFALFASEMAAAEAAAALRRDQPDWWVEKTWLS
jgi:4-diphosphocytidyl-2-C-methyl-D-erythritol kinase